MAPWGAMFAWIVVRDGQIMAPLVLACQPNLPRQ
jgi:hypothetical protein